MADGQLDGNMINQSSNSSLNENDNGGFIGINVPLLSNETFRQIREQRFSMLKPWSDFFDWRRISKPKDVTDLTKRISHNLVYFQANYVIVVIVLLIYIMITNLLLLLSVVLIGAGFYYISKRPPNEPLTLFGKYQFDQKKLYIILGVLSLILLYLSSGGSALFWIVSVSSSIIFIHASLLEQSIESEFTDTV